MIKVTAKIFRLGCVYHSTSRAFVCSIFHRRKIMKQRMSKARFIQEYVLDRRGRFEDNVLQAEKAYLHLSQQGYGDDEFNKTNAHYYR